MKFKNFRTNSCPKNSLATENHCYIKALLELIGITDVTLFRTEGTTNPNLKEELLAKVIANISQI